MGASNAAAIAPGRRGRALALLARQEPSLRRLARRVSICADDADDALQRAVLILLTKAPDVPAERLAAWMAVVTRREALAVRRARERLLQTTTPNHPAAGLACESPGPAERAEQRERVAAAAALLARLKPDERTAIALQAEGYSYAEIGERLGWTFTKVNRCLAEGRARLRQLRTID
jgi:RNA polymerase sigma factor (sigma-70 family)